MTDPPEVGGDLFSWVYCFRAVAVEQSNHQQFKVYLPDAVTTPSAGQQVAVFKKLRKFGSERMIGSPYTPHVAVVSGRKG